jgi:ElaB/YqjD/DUF883 family membrane-anchored ribosome-binding protein
MATRREASEESPLREELAQLRADLDSLIGTVGRLADGAASTLSHEARRAMSDAGTRAGDAYDYALEEGREALRTTEKTIQTHPFLSLALAAGLGWLLGRLMSSR